jgi:hypothetical protein
MKTLFVTMLIATGLAGAARSQNVNWKSLAEDQRNIIQLTTGYDYGVTAQLDYSRSLTLIRPAVVGLNFSIPMGQSLIDDFKIRAGVQVEIVESGGFSVSVKLHSVLRRYQNALVRIVSFGSDFAATAGYYTPSWYGAGEFGFDKSIVSNLKHSEVMKSDFPAIRDGWYLPTGGNFYFGVQGGKTLGKLFEVSLRLGATKAQKHDDDTVLPYYVQLGVGVRF